MIRFICLFTAVFCLTSTSWTQKSIQEILSTPFASNLTVSHDGNTIAWVFNIEGERNIYLAKGVDFKEVVQITSYEGDQGVEIGSLQFTRDNNSIVYVRGNSTNRSGEPANPALLQESTERTINMISTDGEDLQKIAIGSAPSISPDQSMIAYLHQGQIWYKSFTDLGAKPKLLVKARGSAGSLRWSPNGKKLAFRSNRGDHAYIGIYDLEQNELIYDSPTVDRDISPEWSPDGNFLAYIRIPNAKDIIPFTPRRVGHPWSIRVLEVQTGISKTVWTADKGPGSILFGSFPSQKLAWAGNGRLIFPWEKDGWVHLYALDAQSGQTKLITPGAGIVEDYVVAKDARTIYVTSNIGDSHRRHIWKTDVDGQDFEKLTDGEVIVYSPKETYQGIVALNASASHTSWPALLKNGKIIQIADELTNGHHNDWEVPQLVEITASDGMITKGTLFYPPDYNPNQSYPAVIFLHGGSRRQMLQGYHYSGYYSNSYALQQYFASQGYIALSLNYRSGIGYGLEFREAEEYGITGASEVRDLIGAGEYLYNREDVDGDRIALWGGSYGGYLTAHGLAQRSDLFAVGVDIHGVHNWNTELPTFAPWYSPEKFPEEAQKAFISSPEAYLEGWEDPVLFIHGDDDRNVPFSETVVLTEQLRDRGIYFEQIVFPDEVHGFLLHKNWLKCLSATFEFIDRYIGQKKN